MIIYKATSLTTGKIYIGQTLRGLKVRKSEHLHTAGNLLKSRPTLFHSAIRELGSGDFTWEILETCTSCDHLNDRERFYIKLLNAQHPNGYNQTIGGHMDGSMSEEIRDRIASSMVKVHENPEYRSKTYPKLKGLVPPNKGVAMSEKQKRKVSLAKKAVYADPTYINPNIGQFRAGEALENIRKGHETRELPTGEEWLKSHKDQYTAEVRGKMRQAKLGKKPANTNQVLCVETNQVFEGLTEAAKSLNINRQSIFLQIKGKLKRVGGKYTFKYVKKSA